MTFNNRLKELRAKHGLTQPELAKALGISKSSVSMYERGEREPDYEMLEMIADYFNVDMNYLLGKDNGSTYYLNPEIAEIAQEIADNPGQRVLFDASRKLSKEDIEKVIQMVNIFVKDNNGND